MVRRAGKSPPGWAMCARPARARSGPSRRTEPRSLPTRLASGSCVRTAGQRTRRVVVPMPSTSAPRSSSSRAITSTSAIRGTLWRTHSWSVRRHAASSGSAAFLFPSTSTRPESFWPPSINSVDMGSDSHSYSDSDSDSDSCSGSDSCSWSQSSIVNRHSSLLYRTLRVLRAGRSRREARRRIARARPCGISRRAPGCRRPSRHLRSR